MADPNQNNIECIELMLSQVSKRVESLREQALNIQEEKQSLLELLQDMQSNANRHNMSEVEREDIESMTERLILRCLTVDISVSTPRNETQEEAYKCVSEIIDKLNHQFQENPGKLSCVIESYLNACLPEPVSSNIDTRFQSKVLGCAIDDQKSFRRKLQNMFKVSLKSVVCNGNNSTRNRSGASIESDSTASGNGSSNEDSQSGITTGLSDMKT